MMRYSYKRRRIGRSRLRFKRRKKRYRRATTTTAKVKKLIAKSQEQKTIYTTVTPAALNTFAELQFGTTLTLGTDRNKRIGDNVFLKGCRVQLFMEHLGDGVSMGNWTRPVRLNFLVIQSKDNSFDPQTKWYLNQNSIPIAFNAEPNIAVRMNQRINKKNIIVYSRKVWHLEPRFTNAGNAKHSVVRSYYVPIKKHIRFNVSPADATPYARSTVLPNVYAVYYIEDYSNNTLLNNPVVASAMSVTWYYRE